LMGKNDTLVDICIPVTDLIDDTTMIEQSDGDTGLTDGQSQQHAEREVHRKALPHLNMLCSVKATAYTLPYISIRQSSKEVTDFEDFYKIAKLDGNDVRACPSGLVYIHIHRATNLPAKDSSGSSDPYIIASIDHKELFKTKIVYNKCDPIFNHFEDVFVQNVLQSKLTLEVWDRDEMSKDDMIGRLELDLKDVVPKAVNNVFTLSNNKAKAGSVFLSVIFRPIKLPTSDSNASVVLENNIGAITHIG